MQEQMAALEKRDNEVYRSIFEANPVPDSARAKAIEQKKELDKVASIDEDELGKNIAAQLNNLAARVKYQFDSYTSIEKLINNQEAKLASIPAIQPVSNKDLSRVASGFGMRIDPVYGTPKMHKGLDFTVATGHAYLRYRRWNRGNCPGIRMVAMATTWRSTTVTAT